MLSTILPTDEPDAVSRLRPVHEASSPMRTETGFGGARAAGCQSPACAASEPLRSSPSGTAS
jgi:hypothetical protein